ncbi:MarR family transcriptional regulator [Pigmentiphaga sp. NML030171]|uniref:MarR family winged helix-turn-helix transcriptional regulator n=1 Tax=Pigmentiphaga sp. NML030171 TaxID=2008676 RepID=UPI000B40E6E8|nr:MarR family transcriptional regulator [Pigmentiphaga sp. NML030171]OVZ64105.1 MarR family transcriptional regulator [Pigmentiphaga sp. NML030171]
MNREQRGLQVIQRLGQTYRAMQAGFSGRIGHALPRWRILLTLAEHGTCPQKLLAERCRLDPASLTRLLHALEQLGWIARQVDAQDNRQTNVSLTAAGQEVVDEAMPRRAAFLDEVLQGLSEKELDALLRTLEALEGNFRQAATGQASQPRVCSR